MHLTSHKGPSRPCACRALQALPVLARYRGTLEPHSPQMASKSARWQASNLCPVKGAYGVSDSDVVGVASHTPQWPTSCAPYDIAGVSC